MKNFLPVLLLLWGPVLVCAQEDGQAHTRVNLISEQNAAVPGQTFLAAVDFNLDPGWHVYWRNPGDSGMAPKIKWELPQGIKAGDIQWPYPERLDLGPLTMFSYEKHVSLLVPVTVNAHFTGGHVPLKASVNWLACQEQCVPGHADLHLSLPLVKDVSQVAFGPYKKVFDQTLRQLPQHLSFLQSYAVLDNNQWHLHIQTPIKRGQDITFYPFADNVIEHAAPEGIKKSKAGYEVTLKRSSIYQGGLASLDGIAVNPQGWDASGSIKAAFIDAPLEMPQPHIGFWIACLFALIGGLILNLMPCVLPVLSIKVLHLVERHPDRRIAFCHSLVYALGIMCSVWSLGLLLAILKAAGKFAGWGFQFQSPVFVIVVAVILFILALNLFGVFEFGAPALEGLPTAQGYRASFITGIITTIVASPCTAPFMGTALTAAISQPGLVGFGIFTFLGLGLALPFVVLSAFPFLLSFLPKPGAWMIALKKALGLVLLICVVWLLWVFGIQTGAGDFLKFAKAGHGIQWQDYSSGAVAQVRQSGHAVFIDFTAAWCINCQVNDRLVLQDRRVVAAFKHHGVIAFKADWTKYNPAITLALASFGRDSIPVYIYYPPGADAPVVLSQVITPQTILDRVEGK